MVTSYRFFDIYLYKQDYDMHTNKTFSHSDFSLNYFINFFEKTGKDNPYSTIKI